MKNAVVVGLGIISPMHINAIKDSAFVNLYGVCDIDKEKRDAFLNDDVKIFDNFDDVLKDENVDSVHICTPHYLHTDMAIKAINAKKDVVLEKPCAMNREDLLKLYDVYKNSNQKVCVMIQTRTNNAVRAFKETIKNDKTLGELLSVTAFQTWIRDKAYYDMGTWRGKLKTEGGGCLINQAIHLLDLVGYLTGGIDEVKASLSTKYLTDVIEVEDTLDALLKLKCGKRALFYASNANETNQSVRLELEFENATLRYADSRLYKITNDDVEVLAKNEVSQQGKSYWCDGHGRCINAFYSGEEKKDNYSDLTDALNTSLAVCAIYESGRSNGEWVKV